MFSQILRVTRTLYKTYAAKEPFGMSINFILCHPHSKDSDIKFLPQDFGIGAQQMEWSDDLASKAETKRHQGPLLLFTSSTRVAWANT